jgi:hypothetical protein
LFFGMNVIGIVAALQYVTPALNRVPQIVPLRPGL